MASNHSTQTETAFNLLPSLNDLLQPATIVVDSRGQIISASSEALKLFSLREPNKLPDPLQTIFREAISHKKQIAPHSVQIATGIGPTI